MAAAAPGTNDRLLTPAEVATLFRVDPKTVTRWCKAGKLTAIKTLGGHRRYRESEVKALLSGIPQEQPGELAQVWGDRPGPAARNTGPGQGVLKLVRKVAAKPLPTVTPHCYRRRHGHPLRITQHPARGLADDARCHLPAARRSRGAEAGDAWVRGPRS